MNMHCVDSFIHNLSKLWPPIDCAPGQWGVPLVTPPNMTSWGYPGLIRVSGNRHASHRPQWQVHHFRRHWCWGFRICYSWYTWYCWRWIQVGEYSMLHIWWPLWYPIMLMGARQIIWRLGPYLTFKHLYVGLRDESTVTPLAQANVDPDLCHHMASPGQGYYLLTRD